MSGLEVAGLVLGAFSAVHQLTGNSKDNAGIFGRTKEVQKANLEIRQKLFLQSKSFHRGFRRLFSGIIDESEMDALLKDPQSGIWDDEGLDADFRQHFSDEYESARIALNRVHKALMEIEQTLQKLSKTGREELYLTEVHSVSRRSVLDKVQGIVLIL